jgi:hypothetical protein
LFAWLSDNQVQLKTIQLVCFGGGTLPSKVGNLAVYSECDSSL